MSRDISAAAKAAMFAQNTDSLFVTLLEITTNEVIPTELFMCDYSENVTYLSNTYTAFPFALALPSDENGQISEAQISIDNVSRVLIDEIRGLENAMSVVIRVVDITQSPISEEAFFDGFTLRNVTYDAVTITGKLSLESFLAEPFPKDVLSAAGFPGLF